MRGGLPSCWPRDDVVPALPFGNFFGDGPLGTSTGRCGWAGLWALSTRWPAQRSARLSKAVGRRSTWPCPTSPPTWLRGGLRREELSVEDGASTLPRG
ncbi:MAG: hypothetical protein ACP5KY_03195 [Thermoproteus sp.]